ncbi:MAG: hypothetical protein ACRDTV_11485, partial [Mycobacterium sp.]
MAGLNPRPLRCLRNAFAKSNPAPIALDPVPAINDLPHPHRHQRLPSCHGPALSSIHRPARTGADLHAATGLVSSESRLTDSGLVLQIWRQICL